MQEYDEFQYKYPILNEFYDPVIKHLRCNFFPHEVMNKAVGLTSEGESHELLETLSLRTLKDNLSVMAVHTNTNKIAAVSLNGILRKGDLEKDLEKLNTLTDEKYKLIFGLLIKFNLSSNIFAREEVNELFECRILSVDNTFRGKGLGGKLIDLSEEVCRKGGFKVFKADVTGAFSQKIFLKRGFEVIFETKYEDIKDENGDQLIKTEPPHSVFKTVIKNIY
ncbi:arylalkylamine N-acetyltransferase-like 7 isoform X2 [Rhodnius prolixus]